MTPEFTPLAVLFGFRKDRNTLRFLGRTSNIDLAGHSTHLLRSLALCNGFTSIEEIRRRCEIRKDLFGHLIEVLQANRVIVDSRMLAERFHQDSANPTLFDANLLPSEVEALQNAPRRISEGEVVRLEATESPLLSLLKKRTTVRAFSDTPLAPSVVGGLLEATYGQAGFRSTPSGGGLYPLRIFAIIPGTRQPLPQVIYEFDPRHRAMVKLERGFHRDRIQMAFDSVDYVDRSAVIVVIAADLE